MPLNYGIKWFYSKIISHDHCMRRTSNHLFRSHANFFGLHANLFRWPFFDQGHTEDDDVWSLDGDHPLNLLIYLSLPTRAHSRSPVIPSVWLILYPVVHKFSIVVDCCTSDRFSFDWSWSIS
jgi:hypothetical protein